MKKSLSAMNIMGLRSLFIQSFFLALNPSKIVDRIGKILTPVLLFSLLLLFVQCFISPLGEFSAPSGSYAAEPFLKGFQEGYLTMDLLAFIVIGTIVINSIKDKGVTEKYEIGRLCIVAGFISATLMGIVYISLAYLGAVSLSALGEMDNGGMILASVANIYFGNAGSVILAIIIFLAIILFNAVTANIGLTALIAISVPFLIALYPIVIVLVIVSLISLLSAHRTPVYRWSLALTLAFSVFDGLNAANLQIDVINTLFSEHVPFYQQNLGWATPALLGAGIGYLRFIRHKG